MKKRIKTILHGYLFFFLSIINILIQINVSANERNINNSSYLIGPGDIVNLIIYDSKEFSGEYQILNDGSITLPLVGRVSLNYLTLEDANNYLTELYGAQLLRPELYLGLKSARPIKVSLTGEIERPGIYSLTINESVKTQGGPQLKNSGLPTVIDAIQKAGGISQDANLREVILKRRMPGDKFEYKYTKLNLLDLIISGDLSQNLFLFDGDVLEIKKAKVDENQIINISKINISPKTIRVNVIGQVVNQGRIEVEANTPLLQAILQAGGPKPWKANKGNVELIRINKNGTISRNKYVINYNNGVQLSKNPPLINGDTIIVNESLLSKTSGGLNTIVEPVSPLISIFTLLKLLD